MDKVINKLAGLGVPGLVLAVAIAMTGLSGAAAIVVALSSLGGPFGMLGGIGVLILLALTSSAIAKYGIEKIAIGIVKKLIQEGKSKKDIIREVEEFPVISKELKLKIKDFVERA